MADISQEETDSTKNEETQKDEYPMMKKRSIRYAFANDNTEFECGGDGIAVNEKNCLVTKEIEIDLPLMKKRSFRYASADDSTESECGGDANAVNEKKWLVSKEIEIDFESFFLDELEELANSDYIHKRQLAARKILDSLKKAATNREEYHSIISVMCKLSEDEESMVRSELVQHIPSIALYCQNHPDLKLVISQQLVPYTVKLLNDDYISVRKLAQTALLVLLENNLIGQLQLSEWICPLVAQLAVCDNNHDELRIEDVTVMSLMMPLVESSLTTKFFLDPYISLCRDNFLGIRTVCAMRFGTLCRMAGSHVTEISLIPAFRELCYDVAWGVRKACASVFVEVANAVSLKTRKEVLSPMLLRLLDDSANSVRLAAYQSLGAFICSFADPIQTGFVWENGKLNFVKVDDLKEMELNVNTSPITKEPKNEHLIQKEDNCDLSNHTIISKETNTVSVESNSNSSFAPTALTKDINISVAASAFNNFQYWREPLPDIDVNISEETKNCNAQTCVQDSQETSNLVNSFPEELPKVNYSDTKLNSLEDHTEALTSPFKESILSFDLEDSSEKSARRKWRVLQMRNVSTNASDFFFNQDIVPNDILMKYLEALMSNSAMDDELNAACAFSFPAVIYTLGRKYWPCLRATFERVTRNVQNFSEWKNRCAIASSLPQLANLLGHEIILEDLLPKFLDFLTDVDEVRQSVVLQIPDFLQHVPPEERCQFFLHLEDFLEDADSMKWRFRCCVAEQLSAALKLYNSYNINKYFLPVALTLLQDKVFSVRLAAAGFMASILNHIMDDLKMPLLSKLDMTYRQARKWNQRQMYVLICEQLAKQRSLSVEIFITEIVPRLFSLAWDVVPNVRLAVSRCIALTLLPLDYLPVIHKSHSDLFLEVYFSLQSDIDEDVRQYGLLCARAYSAPSYENEMVWSTNRSSSN